jgi:hypothetical protein
MSQVGRNLTDSVDGLLQGKRYPHLMPGQIRAYNGGCCRIRCA